MKNLWLLFHRFNDILLIKKIISCIYNYYVLFIISCKTELFVLFNNTIDFPGDIKIYISNYWTYVHY